LFKLDGQITIGVAPNHREVVGGLEECKGRQRRGKFKSPQKKIPESLQPATERGQPGGGGIRRSSTLRAGTVRNKRGSREESIKRGRQPRNSYLEIGVPRSLRDQLGSKGHLGFFFPAGAGKMQEEIHCVRSKPEVEFRVQIWPTPKQPHRGGDLAPRWRLRAEIKRTHNSQPNQKTPPPPP